MNNNYNNNNNRPNSEIIKENILHLTFQNVNPQLENERRQFFLNELIGMENNSNPKDMMQACSELLLDIDYARDPNAFSARFNHDQGMGGRYLQQLESAVSYCAQAIGRWVASGHAPALNIPFLQMHAALVADLCFKCNLPSDVTPPPLADGKGGNVAIPVFANGSPGLGRVHSVALSRVILACAKHTFPNEFPSLFTPFFDISDRNNVQETATYTPLLQGPTVSWQLVEFFICNILGFDELHPAPKHLIELEKRALQAVSRNSHGIITCLFGALENHPAGVNNLDNQIYSSIMNIVEALVLHAKPEVLTGRPAQLIVYGFTDERIKNEEFVSSCGSLFTAMCAKRGIISEKARDWLRQVIEGIGKLLQNKMWDAACCFLEGFEELPLESLQDVAPEVAELVTRILQTESLFFSHKMLPVLNKLVDSAISKGVTQIVNILRVSDLIRAIFNLAARNKSHPRFSNRFKSASMSELQFVSDDQYENTFGEFRGMASKLLKMLAHIAPDVVADILPKIVQSELRPPNTNNNNQQGGDRTNRNGHIQNFSNLFFAWDACSFVLEYLCHCYEVEPQLKRPIQPLWDSLVGRINSKLDDAVLVPLYLNMMAALWKAPDTPWLQSIDLLLHYATLKPKNPNLNSIFQDQDVVAARRRALTLLVRLCTDHGNALSGNAQQIWERMQSLQISGSLLPMENNFLLEAAASLSCAMSDSDQANFLNSFVSEPAVRILNLASNCTPDRLREIIFSSPTNNNNNSNNQNGGVNDNRNTPEQQIITDDLGLIVGVARRCAGKNYARELMQNLIGPITNLTTCLHNLHDNVPPQFQAAFELPEEVHDAMNQQEGSRYGTAAEANSHHQVDPFLKKVRGLISRFRVNLYHLLPTAMKIFGSVTDQIARCLEGIQMAKLPIHVAKAAVDNLFVLAIELYPPCLPLCTRVVTPLFTTSSNRQQQQHLQNNQQGGYNNNNNRNNNNNNNNVMLSRQLFFIYRSFYASIKNHVLTNNLHKQNRDICVAIVDFLTGTIQTCPDVVRVATSDAAALVADIPDDQMAGQFFLSLCLAIGGPGQGLARKDLEQIAGGVFDVYQKNFDRFSKLLRAALPEHFGELLNRFHGALTTLQRFPPKRARFIEFCVQLCS